MWRIILVNSNHRTRWFRLVARSRKHEMTKLIQMIFFFLFIYSGTISNLLANYASTCATSTRDYRENDVDLAWKFTTRVCRLISKDSPSIALASHAVELLRISSWPRTRSSSGLRWQLWRVFTLTVQHWCWENRNSDKIIERLAIVLSYILIQFVFLSRISISRDSF